METEDFYDIKDKIHDLVVDRKWYDSQLSSIFGIRTTPPYYIRFSYKKFKKKEIIKKKKLTDLQILEYFKEIIHSKIPESVGCGIRVYFNDKDRMITNEVLRDKETYVVL